jgi:predicted O-linked N-acetylglucosamine transferase (SPINDLY family)
LGNTLHQLGRLEDAEASYYKAIALKPDYVEAHSNFIFYSSHNDLIDAKELYARHCRFGQLFEAPLRSHWPQHLNSREPERCLKIGFVSADLREHSMATFIGPLLELWAHYPNLSLHAYYNHSTNDKITEQLKRHFVHWQVVVGLPDAALADKISADGIDILFDLSGHTAKHRLLTFARKPAPIQVSWMGYPGTTGLMAMDYYFNDRFHLRQGGLNAQFTEKIVYLPAGAPFQQIYKAPPVNTLPSLKNGYVTFGSFNRSNKLSRPVVTLWSQLLRALPSSRMLLGGMPKVRDFDWLIDWFAQEGISSERLSFYRLCDAEVYLDLHHEVDICLDTFPYGGGTTTCHALWMGVPTLTLAGQTLPSRVSACLQSHAGLADFACHHEAEFIEKGLYWSNHLAELAIIRAGLRERFENSAMGQASVIAASVERALRIMWQRWCAGLPAESFEVSTINTGNRQAEGSQ